MDTLWQDLRYGLRSLRKQPAFTALAVLTLALGIGATTTMFSVIHNVLLDPFPYKEAERVVAFQIRHVDRPQQGGRNMFQTAEFLDYTENATIFEDVIAGTFEEVLFTRSEGTELLQAGVVSGNNFTFLGVPPILGRALTPDDGKPGAPPVCVLSYGMWRKFFNMDPNVIGTSHIFNGIPTTIVGVMPQRFTKLNGDIYKPIVLDRANDRLAGQYFMFQAKLKPGVTLKQGEAELALLAERFSKIYPDNYPPPGKFFVRLVSWVDNIVGQFRKTLNTLGAAVGLLLLIACSNVANMLLARAASREKEMAIRASLGASRRRLVRQLLIENGMLALLGMLVGCGFAYFGVQALVAAIPENSIPREAQIRLNAPVLAFSLGIAGVTALLFGLVPALQTARRDLVEPLKDGRKGGGSGAGRGKLRQALVVFEVALSLMLLVGAGLLIRSFLKLTSVDLGFNSDNVLVARTPFPRGQYETAAEKQQFFRQLLLRLQSIPGVTAVTTTTSLPPYGGVRSDLDIPGRPRTQERWESIIEFCSEGYFPVLGLKLLRGRLLSESDVNDTRRVIVVNQTFVTRYFGREDPIGRIVRFNRLAPRPATPPASGGSATPAQSAAPAAPPEFEIIGIVSDAKNQGVEQAPIPQAYMPFAASAQFQRGIMLRTAGDPLAILNTVRREIWAVDRNIAITNTDSLANFLRQYTYASPRFSLLVLGAFAGVGLVLVVLGVYSVISYTVSQQTHEFGIRMALGAARQDILHLVLRGGVRTIALGLIIGLLASINLTNLLAKQLGGNEWTHDPLTLGIVLAVVAAAGVIACYLPALRATRVDPLVALRHD